MKNQFSDKNGFTCKNHPNAPAITGKVSSVFRKVEAFVLSDKCRTLEDVINWNREESSTLSVIEFIKSELKRNNPSYDVLEYHNSLIKRLEEFGKIRVFRDFTYENIVDFDAHLRLTIKSQPTLYKRHAALHRYVREAINRGLCNHDPYMQFRIKKGKSKDPVFLLENEIEKIKNWNPASEKLEHVKDLFVFQCFTGMAYVDMCKFAKEDISEIDGKKVIRSNREKTDESFISLLLPEAEKILIKYDYQLPVMTNQKYNDYLKLLGAGAEITKNLTTHVARHTFATYLLNKDIPIESVSRAMGHSNIKMTQHYAKMLGKKVVNDMSVLLD
ncbi:MAG: site-specific integrase [Dysgonamonadaceae bacterium]|nr:site-specific integrase [Dysgonamonadaceae bacterium]